MQDHSYSIELCNVAPDREEMDALLSEYYQLMIDRLNGMGANMSNQGETALQEFWDEIDLFLPPAGYLFLARDSNGDLIGCGSLKNIGNGKGELKRLYVKPVARGTGLGKALVKVRIEAAQKMGLKELLADTVKVNVEMQGLYAKLGFSEIDLYPESSSFQIAPELMKYFCFLRLEL